MKFVWFLSSAISPDRFDQVWRSTPDRWMPGYELKRWVRSLAVSENTPFFGGVSKFSAVEELWLADEAIADSRRVMLEIRNGLGEVLGDAIDHKKSLLYLVENTPVISGPECIGGAGIRQFALARRRDGITHEDFLMHWRYVHGPLVRNSPYLSSYVQNRIVRDINIEPYYDGFSELSFVNIAAVHKFCKSDAYLSEQIAEDAPKFVDVTQVIPTMIESQGEVFSSPTLPGKQ